jgi:hypothetical protein
VAIAEGTDFATAPDAIQVTSNGEVVLDWAGP